MPQICAGYSDQLNKVEKKHLDSAKQLECEALFTNKHGKKIPMSFMALLWPKVITEKSRAYDWIKELKTNTAIN